jgi:hypothetical protein
VTPLVCTTAVHLALKSDPASWSRCELLGVQSWEAFEDEPAGTMEVRLCPHCGSSLGSVVVK